MQDSLYSTPTTHAATSSAGSYSAGSASVLVVFALVFVLLGILFLVGAWKMYKKAGKPGWAAIVPIYNVLVLCEIIGRPWWWLVLMFVPFISLIVSAIMAIDQAKAFGKSTAFGIVAMWLFPVVGTLMLGFGSAQYVGPGGGSASGTPASPPANPVPPANPTPPANSAPPAQAS